MPLISFNYTEFIDLLGFPISKNELVEKLPMIGGDLNSVEEETIHIEFFPNRPDLTSIEGIVRAARAFFGYKIGLERYPLESSTITLEIDPSVKPVRPYCVTALIKNVEMNTKFIASLMDLQEKLHCGIGRNRKKVAIGVHNFDSVTPPFIYKAVDPDSISFIPLAKEKTMTLREILQHHEKGKEYQHLLEGQKKYPIIVDKHDNILSFPPIINGTLTEVTPTTKNIFIDVTGTDKNAIHYTLNIITTAIAERGGTIYTTRVHDQRKKFCSPDLTPLKKTLSLSSINKILGKELPTNQIIASLKKMGYNATKTKKDLLLVEIPPWRADILHEIDLIEDVAIGFGFDKFTTDYPKALTFSKTLPTHILLKNLRTIMIGLGFNEVTTFTISNKNDEFTKMGLINKIIVTIENPIGEQYTNIRQSLLPSLLKLLQENKHHPLPQQIFEIGSVADTDAYNQTNLAFIKIDAKTHFTECKSLVEHVMHNIGKTYTFSKKNHGSFIPGRCAVVKIKNKEYGIFGELHPKTIKNFNLEHPVIAFEFNTKNLL